MDPAIYKYLKQFGNVKANVSLAKFTTFKVGGPASLFIEVKEREKLIELLGFLTGEGISYFILGGGSNVLISDNGFEGVVIKNSTSVLKNKNEIIEAESGVSFGVLSLFALQNNFSGLEWSAGLPGTVGGAIRGNAGAAGGETGKVLSKIEAWIDGELVELNPAECGFGYRDSIFKHNGGIVLKGWFKLVEGESKKSLLKMQEILNRRAGYYPPYPSAGSFFKNVLVKDWPKTAGQLPPEFVSSGKVPAGWINEQAGLKGLKIGGAMVSEQHGNFMINIDKASSEDVLKLVDEVKTRVYNKFGVNLEEEVQIIS
ncbi:MAG: UDP-N-acetylmuramate dehydrogenase [Patescibacteria group bacterium]